MLLNKSEFAARQKTVRERIDLHRSLDSGESDVEGEMYGMKMKCDCDDEEKASNPGELEVRSQRMVRMSRISLLYITNCLCSRPL